MSSRDIVIERKRSGLIEPTKGSFPVRYGELIQITTPELKLELDVTGRSKYLTGRSRQWPNTSEYLKRTDGDDWIYYSLTPTPGTAATFALSDPATLTLWSSLARRREVSFAELHSCTSRNDPHI